MHRTLCSIREVNWLKFISHITCIIFSSNEGKNSRNLRELPSMLCIQEYQSLEYRHPCQYHSGYKYLLLTGYWDSRIDWYPSDQFFCPRLLLLMASPEGILITGGRANHREYPMIPWLQNNCGMPLCVCSNCLHQTPSNSLVHAVLVVFLLNSIVHIYSDVCP